MPEEEQQQRWYTDEEVCHFCVITATATPTPNPSIAASPSSSAHIILSTESVLAFLEVAPMSRGHIVFMPRQHASKISDLPSEMAAVMGFWLPIISRSVMTGLMGSNWQNNDESWNILQANGRIAGQTIKHVHFHIIPRPRPEMASVYGETKDPSMMMIFEKRRADLASALKANRQADMAIEACRLIRSELKKEILRMKSKGEIVEGEHEWEMWAVINGKKMLRL